MLVINPSEENQKKYYENQILYYQLIQNGSAMTAYISQNDDYKDGWFVWLKNYRYLSNVEFKDKDEFYTYLYDKYFEDNFNLLTEKNDYFFGILKLYKLGYYYEFVCSIFPLIEYYQRKIVKFDKNKVFRMSKSLKSINVKDDNNEYFKDFQMALNKYLSNIVYAKTLESDEEPNEINRNRIMHGILTRNVNKTDCLKLLCLIKSLIQFYEWLDSFEKVREISEKL